MNPTVTSSRTARVGRQAISRLQDVLRAGGFEQLSRVDRHTGELVDPEARALFSALPTITPATAPHELLEHGILDALPAHVHLSQGTKYRLGREVFVRVPLRQTPASPLQPLGEFSPDGPEGFCHRAVLVGQRGDDFVVRVPGAPTTMTFSRGEIFTWNEPCGVGAEGGTISGVQVDFNDPLLKAHICAGYLDVAEDLRELDFSAAQALTLQTRIVRRLAQRQRMAYAGQGEGYVGVRAGALMSGGQGVCFVQRAVLGAYLTAFRHTLGIEIQMAIGRTLRLDVPHGFCVLLTRPSLQRYVLDPAWGEPLTELKVAFFGPGWGHDRCLIGLEGQQDLRVSPAEIDLPHV